MHNTKPASDQPIAAFGQIDLKGLPTDDVVLNDTAGYAAAITCPTVKTCYAGGATAAGTGEEIGIFDTSKGYFVNGADQPTVSGLEGIACISVNSCEAAEVQNLAMFGQYQGWVEHLGGFVTGTPHELVGTIQMYAVATINHSSYFAAKQPGGLDGVDGAVAIYHLKTPPSAPKVKVMSTTHTSATVHITAPSSNGDVTITSYRLTVSRCKPHTRYYFAATATNAVGTGPSSPRKHAKTK